MIRKDLLLTLSLFAFGIIGGVVYNYCYLPLDSASADKITQAVTNPDPGSFSETGSDETPVDTAPPSDNFPDPGISQTDDRNKVVTTAANGTPKNLQSGNSVLNSLDSIVSESDRYLMAGNFSDAHRLYARVSAKLAPHTPSELLFKLGLSAEFGGHLEVADDYYAEAIRRSSARLNVRLLAMLGLARIKRLNHETELSDEILSELLLRQEGNPALPHEIVFQLKSQLAAAARDRFLQHDTDPNPFRLEFIADQLNLEATLQAVEPTETVSTENQTISSETENETIGDRSPQAALGIRVIQRPSSDAELIALDAATANISMRDALGHLAGITGLKFELDSFAEERIRGRSTKLRVSGLSLALILDNLAGPLGLVWSQTGEILGFTDRRHAPDVSQFDFLAAVRAQRNVALDLEPDDRRSAAILAQGNLYLLNGNYDQAALNYEQLAQLEPNGELLARLTFNRANMESMLGRSQSAVRLLYASIDQSLDFHLQSVAYLMLGNLQLENDDIAQAIQSSARSLSLANDFRVRQDAALNLTRAYLLNNDPYSANKVLFENFEAVNTSSRRNIVNFLGSYARYLGTGEKINQSKARERLMIAMIMLKDSDLETTFDKVIASRAFFEMGLKQRSSQILKMAQTENSVERWSRKIEFQLAIEQLDEADNREAIGKLSRLATDSSDSIGQSAILRLARNDYREKRFQECLQRCHLLTQTSSDQQTIIEALKIMGSAYRSLDQHMSAAVCFSGMVPELYANQSKPSQNLPEILEYPGQQ